jgi:hypothetical protein
VLYAWGAPALDDRVMSTPPSADEDPEA